MAYTTQVIPVSYKQTDRRWANKPYRNKGENSTIGGSGCGPTCAAMLVATFVDKKETPVDACNWARSHGYKATGSGTYYTFFKAYLKAHRMDCEQVPGSNSYHKRNTSSDKKAKAALKAGKYVIACMGPGLWTSCLLYTSYYVTAENEKAAVNLVEIDGGSIDSYIEWQDGVLGRDINPDALRRELIQPDIELGILVDRVEITAPTLTKLDKTQIARFSGSLKVSHEVIEE